MTPDEREEIEDLAEKVEPPCDFVLTGYSQPLPCLRDAHDPKEIHDCGSVLVVSQPCKRAG